MPSQIYPQPSVYAYQPENGSNYIYVNWSFPSDTTVAKAKICDGNTGATLYTYNYSLVDRYTTSWNCYISNPNWNAWPGYAVSVQVFNYDTGDYSDWSPFSYVTMYPIPAPTAPSNISVSYNGMVATITWDIGANTSYTDVWNTNDGTHGTTTGNSWNFTVPTRGVNYYFKLAGVNSAGASSGWVNVPTICVAKRPDNFVGNLYKVDSIGNDVVDVSQWVAFATKVNQFRAYKGLSQYSYLYLNYAQVGNTFSATYFNEMLSSMNGICINLPSYKNTEDTVLKSYFNTMVSQLNSIL